MRLWAACCIASRSLCDGINGDITPARPAAGFGVGCLRMGESPVSLYCAVPYLLFQLIMVEYIIDAPLRSRSGQLGVDAMRGLGCLMRRSNRGCLQC